jgi:lysozyme
MILNKKGLDLIIHFEGGHKLKAYKCPANVWTISVGLIRVYNRAVVESDTITLKESEDLFRNELNRFVEGVRNLLKVELNENQFSALVSFAFNCGLGALRNSTLLKKVNENPKDLTIRQEFTKWNKSGGKVLNGLTRRRNQESDLYFA